MLMYLKIQKLHEFLSQLKWVLNFHFLMVFFVKLIWMAKEFWNSFFVKTCDEQLNYPVVSVPDSFKIKL